MQSRLTTLALGLVLVAAPAQAQIGRGAGSTGVQFQGYSFDKDLGVSAANLLMIPLAYQIGIGDKLSLDAYGAYARGAVEIGDNSFTLNGPVDTRVRANYEVTPWAMLTFGVNLPTGKTEHTADEARVAAVLSSDLLGFREANFGLGFGATAGIATAYRMGETGVGIGVSYRLASEFQPSADTTLKYTPGNEVRVRLGVDRNIGASKLTAGITYQNFARDELDGNDLFQAGNRWRGDMSFSFRTGPGASWTAYATDVYRDRGDIRLPAVGSATVTSEKTGTQNLIVAGVVGAWRARSSLTLQPIAEFRMLSREDPGGEGWLAGGGVSVPLRAGRFAITPGGRLNFGGIEGDASTTHSMIGGEVSLMIGFGSR
jgi:hypothetical protein